MNAKTYNKLLSLLTTKRAIIGYCWMFTGGFFNNILFDFGIPQKMEMLNGAAQIASYYDICGALSLLVLMIGVYLVASTLIDTSKLKFRWEEDG
jgi:hypothetical protein